MFELIKHKFIRGVYDENFFDDYTAGPICANYSSIEYKLLVSIGMVYFK